MKAFFIFIIFFLASFSFGQERQILTSNTGNNQQQRKYDEVYNHSALVDTGIAPPPGMRGTPSNLPDISIIGDFLGTVSDKKSPEIFVREIELAFQGYIYPQMRADIFLALHRHGDQIELDVEEAYAHFLNITDGLNLKVGKMLVDFGKVNRLHPHERSYVDLPISLTNIFGGHGFNSEGITAEYLLPLPFFTQISMGAWWIAGGHQHAGVDTSAAFVEEPTEFSLANKIIHSRLWTSFSTTENSELEIGGSAAFGNGSHYKDHRDDAKIFGADVTFKYWPSAFERFIFQTEIFNLRRTIPVGELKRWSFYNYAGYKPSKYWEFGVLYDWAENAVPEPEYVKSNALSGIVTNHLTETTMIRLQYGHNFLSKSDAVFLNLICGIGPHSHTLK
ncbi:MAG: hypothetical protein QME52_04980 [Bacteroidota bacterium]|nr:hypothetical protein [Bacteroidota bacterium]